MNFYLISKSEFDNVLAMKIDKSAKIKLFADMCRYNALVAVKKAGSGHIGSSFSAMDIVVSLYLDEMNIIEEGIESPDRDIYFSSKGHDVPGLYSVLFALGIIPEDKLLRLRRLGGLDGHPEVRIPGIEANSGSLGMGISKGRGFAFAKKYLGLKGRIFVLTGDGEFQEGQIYESLQATAHQEIANLTVIIDRNKFQTDRLVDDVNSIEDLFEKVSAFGWHVERVNGHKIEELTKTFKRLRDINNKPKFIIADTVKGKGVSFMEEPQKDEKGYYIYKWHSGAPDDEAFRLGCAELLDKINEQALALNLKMIECKYAASEEKTHLNIPKEYVTDAYGDALCEIAERRKDIVVLDGDLSADCRLRKFEKTYPERFVENGIAEQDMVSMAGGMARMGLLPIVNTFASFLSARANEQIYNNACEETKIIYVCHFSGLLPAGPGKSHQSVRDISLFGALPNCVIIQPCNSYETKLLLNWCVDTAKINCALRLAIGPSPRKIELPPHYEIIEGRGATLRDGNDAIIFGYGPVMLHEALTASELLAESGFGLEVVNMPFLNRIDTEWLKSKTERHWKIYVLEDHSIIGGLGDRLLESLTETGVISGREFRKFGLSEYPECGAPLEVLKYHKLDGGSLAMAIFGNYEQKNFKLSGAYTADAPQ